MTKVTRDVPVHEGMTVADRLKAARTEAGFTRKALAEGTGIPASTLEKYERGDMDPNTTRLQTICDYLGVSVNRVLNGDDAPQVAATKETVETRASANVAESFAESDPEATAVHAETHSTGSDHDPIERVRVMLSEMDIMRAQIFHGSQRKAMALENEIRAALKYFDPDDLMILAVEQGLYQDQQCLDASGIHDLFADDLEKGQSFCANIEERVLDTAILGVDLYNIEREPLVKLADELQEEHDIEEPAWGGFSWGEHNDFVPLIRPYMRAASYRGHPVDFTNHNEFLRREK